MTLESVAAWRARGGRVSLLGHSLWVLDAAGPRTPVLLVHGFPTSSHDFSAVLPLLHETRRVLALDLLGYGLSEKPWPHDYTIGEQTDLLEAFAASRGVGRAHLLAHDMGDTVVQELLARRLDGKPGLEPASVVLLNGGIIVEKIRPILAQRVLRSRLGPLAAKLIGWRAFARSLRGIAGRQPAEEELRAMWELLELENGRRCYAGLIRYMEERVARRARWRRATLEHPYPLRLVWADADPISPFTMAAEVQAYRPATDVVRLEGTGHYPQVEEPERVARAALEWFEKHEG